MAGVNMSNDEGTVAGTQQVPTIGGIDGIPSTATIAAGGHVGDAMNSEGTMYPETFGMDVTNQPYPQGTSFPDSSPGDDAN